MEIVIILQQVELTSWVCCSVYVQAYRQWPSHQTVKAKEPWKFRNLSVGQFFQLFQFFSCGDEFVIFDYRNLLSM